MTASPPKVNGHTGPPALQVLGDWQPIGATPTEPAPDRNPGSSQTSAPQPESDLVAQAQAEAIRAKAWAESEERRLAAEAEKEAALKRAEAEADAIRVKAERTRGNCASPTTGPGARPSKRLPRPKRGSPNTTGAATTPTAPAEDAARLAAEQQAVVSAEAAEVAEAEDRWRGYARSFYIVCAIVALPVQVAAFYNPKALWLMAAPLMLEGGAWVVLKGAAAAVASHRPHWHYRLIAWLLAFLAAGINLWHGLAAFDPAAAIGAAFASIAGPGVWDLHEHGRIRKRDGSPPAGSARRRRRKPSGSPPKRSRRRSAAPRRRRPLRRLPRRRHGCLPAPRGLLPEGVGARREARRRPRRDDRHRGDLGARQARRGRREAG
ncbi:hypothetical protein KAURM247S_02326 [Kitasatospora aureofaciens]